MDPSVLARFPGATPDQVQKYLDRADGRVPQAVALFEGDRQRTQRNPASSNTNNNSNVKGFNEGNGKSNEYFVGSGQAVVGRNPPQQNASHLPQEQQRGRMPRRSGSEDDDDEGGASYQDQINAVFERARAQGALTAEEIAARNNAAFTGSGRRLGHLEGPSPVIAPVRRRTVVLRIAFYKNGFIVGDNGPLRPLDDEKGKEFCSAINRGFIPRELVAELGADVDIDVNLEDRQGEMYTPPPQQFTKFGGQGRTMNDSATTNAPSSSLQTNNNNNNAKPATTNNNNNNNSTSSAVVVVPRFDPALDSCKIAVRNLMGKVHEFQVNPTVHTIEDVRRLAAGTMGEPPLDPFSFKLLSSDFPPRPLTDNSLTIEAAKLRNGTVTMRR